MRYIVTNFVYGTGPYLRTTELAIVVNTRLSELGQERKGIIIPWVYGEKQKRIMLEEFADHDRAFPGEILLDAKLGSLLFRIFYGNNTYEESLARWVGEGARIGEQAHQHLQGELTLEDLRGNQVSVRGQDIVMEINRAPRIQFNVAPSYYTTFGYISEILEGVLDTPLEVIAADHNLVEKGQRLAEDIESNQLMHFLAEPGTFSYRENRVLRYPTEVAAPPITRLPRPNNDPISEGIFVTITGIPGLERLYGEAKNLGLQLYSNDPKAVLGSKYLLPHVVSNHRIKAQFARSGWGSVWHSQLSGTPFVTPAFDPTDDPEIYFNNICIEKLGLGIIYRGQSLAEILVEADRLRPGIAARNKALVDRFGTVDGNAYCARRIVEHYLSS